MSNYIYYVKIGTGNSQSGYPEQPQNSCESLPIAVHPNCHLSRWLPLSFHSWLFTPAYALFHFSLCGSLYGYSLPRIAFTSAFKPMLFFMLLFVIMPFSSFQLLVQLMRLLIFSSTASVQPHLMY